VTIEIMPFSMATEKRLKVSRHFNLWFSQMGWMLVLSVLLIGSILAGCKPVPVNRYHTLDISELEEQIANKAKQLKMLETEKEKHIRQEASTDVSTEGRISQIKDEIHMLARWRRLIHLETSGRYSGPKWQEQSVRFAGWLEFRGYAKESISPSEKENLTKANLGNKL
jgi:hypothetical protein